MDPNQIINRMWWGGIIINPDTNTTGETDTTGKLNTNITDETNTNTQPQYEYGDENNDEYEVNDDE